MITITSQEIIDYRPAISKYSGFDRDNTVFDKYISSAAIDLKRLLALDSVDVDSIEIESSENMRQLYLSYIVYQFYFERSFNVEEDRIMINELEKIYEKNYLLLLKENSSSTTEISSNFLG